MFDDLKNNKKSASKDDSQVGDELIKDKAEPIKQPFTQQNDIARPIAQKNNESKHLAEDIFADTDKGIAGWPKKPDVFKPKTDGLDDSVKDKNKVKQASITDVKKYIIAIAAVLVLVLVVYGGYLAYNKYIRTADIIIEDMNENAAKQPNNNTAETPVQEEKQPELNIEPPKDSDQDGLTDEEEAQLGINPNSVDSDDDGLFDREEVKIYKTDPKNPDTDGDGYLDGAEVKDGYNPNGTGKLYER